MASPVVTPNKKRCVMCQQEKGSTAFIKDGDLCTKCRNTETNPLCLKRGQPPIWSSTSPQRGSPNRLLGMNQSDSSIINNSSVLQHPIFRLTNSAQLEEKNVLVTPNIDAKTLEHKVDLILESTLEMERNQIQVASIRSEMHKFLVDLSHLNNNVEPEEDQKYQGLDSLAATMEQHFVSTRNEISTLQETISTLKDEIMSSISQRSKALEDSWGLEIERREQIWQARLIEERKARNERILEERKQWQQCLEQQNVQLQQILQEDMKHWRQEYLRFNTEMFSRIENRTSETLKVLAQPVINTNSSPVNTLGSSNISVSQSKPPDLGSIFVGRNNLSIEPSNSPALAVPLNSVPRNPMSIKPKPPIISIKRPVVKNQTMVIS